MFGFCNFIRFWTKPALVRAALITKKRTMTARCCETRRNLLQRRRSHLTGKHKACLYNTTFVFEITGGVVKVNSSRPWFHIGTDHLTARFSQHNSFLWGKKLLKAGRYDSLWFGVQLLLRKLFNLANCCPIWQFHFRLDQRNARALNLRTCFVKCFCVG